MVDIRGWDVETGRSVASVTWADGTTNVYRVGHKGKVDLKCTVEASGGFYYKEHLPKLGGSGDRSLPSQVFVEELRFRLVLEPFFVWKA